MGDRYMGIDLSKDIHYLHASFRYYAPNEHHVTRYCNDNVLLLVFEGVLRFGENGTQYEVGAGEYFIQKHCCYQSGELASDAPKYLYIHFNADWRDDNCSLARRGSFNYARLKDKMEEMNELAYSDAPYIIKAGKFYEILTCLAATEPQDTPCRRIAEFIEKNLSESISLEMLCKHFAFSKNYIIQMFKKEYGQTPIMYLNTVRLRKAEQLLVSTSHSILNIALECGYPNYSHFYRLFVRRNSLSPEQYRSQMRIK